MRHARYPFETTKNHLGKQITLKTGSGSSQKRCGRTEDGRRMDGGRTHTHQIFEALYTISPGGQILEPARGAWLAPQAIAST